MFGRNGFGTMLSFTLKESAKNPFAVLDSLQFIMMSTGLGDNRTMTLPVTQTIYAEMTPERRAEWGIADGLIRVAVGIEHIDDLIADWAQALV